MRLPRLLAVFGLATLVAQSVKAEVAVGDTAPEFKPGKWVQGEPVETFDKEHVYIVEFWATWCGPCRVSIPHVNGIWQKYKDKGLIVIGQDVWDSDEAVAPFVKKMGTNMTYRVALDNKEGDKDGFMDENWWKRGTNHHAIPEAFVIKDQRVAWMGHPMSLEEKVLDGILASDFDFNGAAAAYQKELQTDQEWEDAQDRLFKSLNSGQYADAQEAMTRLLKINPAVADNYSGLQFRILLGEKKYDEAYQLAEGVCNKHSDDADRQNNFAWTIVAQKGLENPNLKLAETLAERAIALTASKNASYLDTLARVQFMSGDKASALATEQKAVDLTDGGERKNLQKTLEQYQAGQLPEASL